MRKTVHLKMIQSISVRFGVLLLTKASLIFMAPSAFADAGITYHGRLLSPNGSPVTASNVQFRLQLRTPQPSNCLMYEEIQTKDLSASHGVFSITINDGSATTANTEPYTLDRVFQNRGGTLNFPAGKCSGVSTYNPDPADGRILSVSFNDGSFSGWEPLPTQSVAFVPSALEAVTVGGYRGSQLFKVEDNPLAPPILAPWSVANYQKLVDLVGNTTISGGNASIGGTASGFTGSLSGDVTGGQSSTKVEKIQGRDVLDSAPSNGQVLTWNNAQTRWEAANLPAASAPSWNDITGKPSTFPAGGSAGGDLSGSYPNPEIAANAVTGTEIANGAVGPSKLTAGSATGQVLRYDTGSGWAATKLNFMDLVNGHGASPWPSGSCNAGEAIVWQSTTDGFSCQAISFTETDPKVGANTLNMLSKWNGTALVASGVYEDGGNVGIGTLTPAGRIELAGENINDARMYTTLYSSDTNAPGLIGRKARGDFNTPSGVLNGDYLAAFGGRGYHSGGAFGTYTAGAIMVQAAENFTPTSQGTNLVFHTTNTGSATASEKLRITSNGQIGIGTASPSSMLHLASSSGSVGVTVENKSAVQSYIKLFGTGGTTSWFGTSSNGGLASGITDGDTVIRAQGGSKAHIATDVGPVISATSTGLVGIGTTSPSEKLEVVGNVKATQLCIGADCRSAWPGSGGGGTVTSVTAGTGLATSPGTGITGSGSIGIAAGGVSATELAANAVTTAKILDGNVTGAKLETVAGLSAGSYGSATSVPAITVDAKGRVTAVTTNNITGLLPTASGVSGKYLKSDGTNWAAQDVRFSDIKNIGGTSAFNVGSCAANQTVAWSSLTDMFSCQNIGSLDASTITAGTLNAARLPTSVTDALWTASSGNIYRSSGNVGIGTTSPGALLQVGSGANNIHGVQLGSSASLGVSYSDSNLVLGRNVKVDTTNNVPGQMLIMKTATEGAAAIKVGSDLSGTISDGIQFHVKGSSVTGGDVFSSEVMRINHNGNVGIGTAAPMARLEVESRPVDTSVNGLFVDFLATTTASGTVYNRPIQLSGEKKVAAAVTDSGDLVSTNIYAYRNLSTSADNGTLTNLTGINVQYGHYNADATASPVTNTARGLTIAPQYMTGTVTNMYDLFLAPAATGGTATNRWSIYQQDPAAKNYFAGNVGIGTASPTQRLHIANTGTTIVRIDASTGDSTNGNAQVNFVNDLGSLADIGIGRSGLAAPYANALIVRNQYASGDILFGTGGTLPVIFKSSGNVGIGTTTPTTKLEVNGTVKATAFEGPMTSTTVGAGTGSNTTPSLTFSGDTDTGFYNTGSNDTISITTGGIKIFDFISNGLTSPTTGGALIKTGNGDATTPTFSFSGDPDTGWFRPTADTLAASTGGTEKVRITSTGNVGIGTANPQRRFHVESAGNVAGRFDITTGTLTSSSANLVFHNLDATNGNSTGILGHNSTGAASSGVYFVNTDHGSLGSQNGAIDFWTASAGTFDRRLRITPSGHVGIGTTSPGPLGDGGTPVVLQVSDTGGTGNFGLLQLTTDATAVASPVGALTFATTGTAAADKRVAEIVAHTDSNSATTPYGRLSFWTANGGAETEKMRITAAGNVGIGTTNPTGKLHLSNLGNSGELIFRDTSGAAARIYNPNGYLVLQEGGGAGVTINDTTGAVVTVTGGKVGVGTSTPYARLSVAGPLEGSASGDVRHYQNLADYYIGASSATGTMKITLPNSWTNTMMVVSIKGYDYGANGAWEVVLGGYNYSTSSLWYNTTAEVRGKPPFTNIRLAHDGSKNVILLGTTSTTWSYASVAVTDFWAGYSNREIWGSGWSIGLITSETGITSVSTPTIPMYINSSNNVGIGTTNPSYKLDVQGGDINASGSVRAAGVALTSDVRYKRDIEPLDNALERILDIRGVSYHWRTEEFPQKHFNERRQIGVIAQEVEAQFPEAVDTNNEGYKSVNYPALVAPLIESVRALYDRILGLENRQTKQARQIASKADQTELELLKTKNEKLEQENTAIKAYLCAKDRQAPFCP